MTYLSSYACRRERPCFSLMAHLDLSWAIESSQQSVLLPNRETPETEGAIDAILNPCVPRGLIRHVQERLASLSVLSLSSLVACRPQLRGSEGLFEIVG